MTGSGIPTRYAGAAFRSRLEARWAALFDQFGWRWEYEPAEQAGWLPDFAVRGVAPLLVEVKPAASTDSLLPHTAKLEASGAAGDLLLVGETPYLEPAISDNFRVAVSGLIRERGTDGVWTQAVLFRCGVCGQVGVCSDWNGWDLRPCGHHDGDRHLRGYGDHELSQAWIAAGNATQWSPPEARDA